MKSNRTLKDWVIAVRPWSFPASVMPVLVSLAYLWCYSSVPSLALWSQHAGQPQDMTGLLLCLPLMILVHAGGNLVSDYYDHIRGVDKPDGPNGVTWIHDGTFAPREILHYGLVLLSLGAAVGALIISRTGGQPLWIGALGLALALGYPWLKAHVLGDVDIFMCFALLPSLGMGYVGTGDYLWEMVVVCLPYGMLTVAILHANNTRDIANDTQAGLHTAASLMGWRGSQWSYVAEQWIPYALVAAMSVAVCLRVGLAGLSLLLVVLTLPLARRNTKAMMAVQRGESSAIGQLDKLSAQEQLSFGLLYALGFVVLRLVA